MRTNIHKNRLSKSQPVTALGLYVHVPFCATTCNFCAFVQSKPDRNKIQRYLDAIRIEWQSQSQGILQPFDTIFWGGGTPGLLLPNDLKKLGSVFESSFDSGTLKEWTVEMAPATVTPSKLKTLKEMGVNRISMGVQTFCDETLKIMDRFHTVAQIHRAWEWIKNAEFQSCSIDMIIAYPGQTLTQLHEDLEKAIRLEPDHISTYCLTFEEDTPLYAKLMQGIYKIDRDAEADLYRATWEFLESKGFAQYEISNFSKPGHQSIHNLNTWRMQQWIGFGPSASSQFRNHRWTNLHDFEKWANGCNSTPSPYQEYSSLNPSLLFTDCLLFGLRMNEGVNLDELEARFHPLTIEPWHRLFQRLEREGLAIIEDAQLRLTLQGRLLADAIAVEILELAEEE